MKKIVTSVKVWITCTCMGLLLLASGYVYGQTPAFPGALGFGANATGGRGGTVYHVTNLNDSGPGSFRDAVSESNRIVVFDVGGYISLASTVAVESNITIAGQTAPGEGIGFKGGEISFANSTNIICRYIRIRPGSETANTRTDDCLSFYRARNVIVDHVSLEFGPWNNIDGVGDKEHLVENITVQNSIIANPTGQQFGAHTESVDGTWSWFYNIFANSHNRNPLAKVNTVFVNNVLYNYQAGYTTHTSTSFKHDIVNNYFIFGPATSGNTWYQIDENQTMYYSGNIEDNNLDGLLNGDTTTPYYYHGTHGPILSAPWSSLITAGTVHNTQTAYRLTTSLAGTLPRDQVDSLVISQIKTLGKGLTGTGRGTAGPDGGLYVSQDETGLPDNGYGIINGGTPAHDTDGDGMPDFWEQAVGSNPGSDDAMTPGADGYVLIEHYLHWLASPHALTNTDSTIYIDLQKYTGGFLETGPVYTISNISHGNATLQSDGHTVKFIPDAGFRGLGAFDFNVSASDGSSYSSKVTIVVSSEPTIAAPADVVLSAVSKLTPSPKSIVTIKWKDQSDNETHFILERAEKDSAYTKIAEPAADDTLYIDSLNVLPDTTYYYRIKAVNDADTSYYSEPASILTPPLPSAPDTVIAPFPADAENNTHLSPGGKITLSWKGSANTETYLVYFSGDPGQLEKIAEVNDPSYELSGLADDSVYYWRVDAVNAVDTTRGKVWSFSTVSASTPVQEGLVGYWSLDETGTVTRVTDSSQYHNNGTLGLDSNDPGIRIAGHKNNGLNMANLQSDTFAIRIPGQKQLFLDKSSFTISFWMKADPSLMPTDKTTSAYLLCKGSIGTDPAIGSTGKRFDLEVKEGKLRFTLDAGDAGEGGKDELQTSATPLYTGNWVNVIAIRDTADQKLKVYINGELVEDKGISKSKYGIGENSALIIGNIGERELLTGSFTPAPYRGMMDEVKIFNYAMTPAEVATLSGIFPKGLVGYWSFDETGTGKKVIDSSVYKDDGQLGMDTNDPDIRVEGHRNNGIDFSTIGDNDYGTKIPGKGQLFLDQSSFSISLWMKADPSLMPTDKSTSAYLLCKGSIGTDPAIGSTGKRFDLEVKESKLRFALDAGDAGEGGKDELQTDATPLYTGEWVNLIVIRDTAKQKMEVYINGSLVEDKDISKSKYGIGENSALILGNIGERELSTGSFTPAPYRGMMDEVKIFNYPLTYPEIITLFYGSPLPQEPFDPSYNNVTVDGYEDTLKLTWKGGVNTIKYQLFMGPDSTHLTKVVDSIDPNKPIYKIVNAPSQTTYYWRIDAIGILGTTKGALWHFTTGFPKGLVGYWSLDGNVSDDKVIDSTAYEDNGILGPNIVKIPGHRNEAISMQDMNDNEFGIKIPDAPQLYLDKSSFSISFWMKADPSLLQKDVYLLCKGSIGTDPTISSTGKRFNLEAKDGTLYFALDAGDAGSGTGKDQISTDATDIATGEWVNVIAIRDMEHLKMKIYIAGKLVKDGDIKKSKYGIGEHNSLIIGNIGELELSSGTITPAPYNGKIDELKIFNYPLSDALVQKINDDIPFLAKASNPSPADSSIGAGPEKVAFSWIESSGTALAYDFYLGTSPDSLLLIQTGLKDPMFEMDSLAPSTRYYWKIKDSSDAQQLLSDTWSFTTGKDTTKPKALAKSITVDLDASGMVSITAEDVNDQSNDVYGIDTLMLNRSNFNCLDIGENAVILTARDKNGNEASDTTMVIVNGDIPDRPVISPADTVICNGDWIKLFANEDEKAASYQWLYEGDPVDKASERDYPTGEPGRYRVIAVSAQSCPSDTSMPAFVTISKDTLLQVSENVQIARGSGIQLTATGSDGAITWSPDIGISPLSGSPVFVRPVSTTTYVATLTNTLGCKVSRNVLVTVEDQFKSSYNKLLTPNGDGVNDKLVIKNLEGYPNNLIQIFDESGKLVYRKNGYSNDWDGRVKGRSLGNGTYYFILSINHKTAIKGSVTIIDQ